ncbi:MAG: AAA family ATPase [Methylophilaceae bacterium]
MRILAITNQKGGVGKTTTCVNLAASLAATGRRVLLVDLDPQGNATTGGGLDKAHLKHTVYHVLIGDKTLKEVIRPSEKGKFDIAPANRNLAGAEVELVNEIGRETRLKLALAALKDGYDYVLLDCPPALNLVTVNALTAAHAVMIPMQCEYYALEGLSDLVNTIKKVRTHLNPTLEIEGLLRTLFDTRNMLAQQVSAQLVTHFGDKVYRTVIPRNIRLAEAPSYGLPALIYDRASKGAQAYVDLAEEITSRAAVNPAVANV